MMATSTGDSVELHKHVVAFDLRVAMWTPDAFPTLPPPPASNCNGNGNPGHIPMHHMSKLPISHMSRVSHA